MSRMTPDLSPPESEVVQTLAQDLFADLSGAMDPANDCNWDDRLFDSITITDGRVIEETMWVTAKVLVDIRVPLTVDEYDALNGGVNGEDPVLYNEVRERLLEEAKTFEAFSNLRWGLHRGAK